MHPNESAGEEDEYGLSAYLQEAPDEPELAGNAARKVKGHPQSFNVSGALGDYDVPYHGYAGSQGIEGGFVVSFRATYVWELEDKAREVEGMWKLTVLGKNLEAARYYLRMGQLSFLKEAGSPHLKETYISSIMLEPVDPVVYQRP